MGCGSSNSVNAYKTEDEDEPSKTRIKRKEASPKRGSASPKLKYERAASPASTSNLRDPPPKYMTAEDALAKEVAELDDEVANFLKETDDIGLAPKDKEEEEMVERMERAILEEMKEASRNFAKLSGKKTHSKAPLGQDCACCCIEIDFMNYVEYQHTRGGNWYSSSYCEQCLETMLASGWKGFQELLREAKCEAVVRRLLLRLPRRIYDKIALPCPDNQEVYKLWYSSDGEEHTAELKGAPKGKDREEFIIHMKQFAEAMSVAKKAQEDENAREQRTKDDLAFKYGYEDNATRQRRYERERASKEKERMEEEHRMENLMNRLGV